MAERRDAESKYALEAGVFLNIMDEMAPQIGLDYSADSLQRLEAFIAENFDPPGSKQVGDQLIIGIGCYLGEVIIRELGGYWNHEDQPEINDVGALESVYPIDKVRRRFENGSADSLVWAYHAVVREAHQAAQAQIGSQPAGFLDKLLDRFKK